ncbi:P-loop containing nucleoside triphosphate hydrolase protein [Hypomontagnella monticulosa]|nr:P-loop containing nucleoside triphosphate hydrolase protein [Hypomontagnella monticulosa]
MGEALVLSPTSSANVPCLVKLSMDQVQFSTNEAEEIGDKSLPSLQLNDVTEEPGRLQIGVTFSNLEVQARASTDQHHYDFLDCVLAIPTFLVNPLRSRAGREIQTLRECEGIIEPGEMLLVLGQPGSSCSTFLKSLAGKLDRPKISNESQIKYQGISYRKFHRQFKGERVYVGEEDAHFPELTLEQTLDFAASTRSRKTSVATGHDIALELGLDSTLKTLVGSASDSEKRQTSIAEACIGGAQFQCWDNSTRGLDSSTTLRFIKYLRRSADVKRSTIAMSLPQVSEDIYQEFDKVILLCEGRQIYYGPAREAVDYFAEIGFVKPDGVTTADFLTSLATPAERQIYGGNKDHPSLPDEFASVWKQSKQARKIRDDIANFNSTRHLGEAATLEQLGLRTSTYPTSIPYQVFICLKRSILRTRQNLATFLIAAFINALLGLLMGSVYFNMAQTTDSLSSRALLLFLSTILNGLGAAAEVPAIWAQRPIVEKHHRYAFYQPIAANIAEIIGEFPMKIINCFAFNIPLYFMANLRRSGSAFFQYWFFMLTVAVTMSMLFRAIGSLSRTLSQTDIPVAFVTVCCIVYTGFALPHDYVLSWWGWFRRANPLAWAYENVVVNEMHDRLFACSLVVPIGPGYETIDPSQQICAAIGSQPGQPYVQGTAYLAIKYDYYRAHVWRNFGILVAMTAGYGIIHLLAAQFIRAQPRRDTLAFKHRLFSKNKATADEENTTNNASYHPKDLTTIPTDITRRSTNITSVKTPASQAGSLLHWSGVSYDIKGHTIVRNSNGWLQPGTLTALMGAKGAGKTTLLNVLADRFTTGTVTGSISVDGFPRTTNYQRKVGYVQQDDIHLATTTVREALVFSALLRQSKSKSRKEKLAYVEEILELMDMQWYADAVVGVPGEGLNLEQRKRLTIAVELVAQPELLLLLDEPTSGLSSQAAWSLCTVLRRLADNGQTILCAIYEPSPQILAMFDRLLLLGSGGNTLYFGDVGQDASIVNNYLENSGAPQRHPGENPAKWVLGVTSGNLDSSQGDWAQRWEASSQNQEVLNQLNTWKTNSSNATQRAVNPEKAYATSYLGQTFLVTKRTFLDQWRSPAYLFAKLVISVATALINGFSFFRVTLDQQAITGIISSMFYVTYLASHIFSTVVPYTQRGIALFTARERGSRMYSWVSFLCANVFVEACWQTLLGVLVYLCWYYPTGLQRNGNAYLGTAQRGGLTFVCIWLFLLWASTLSQALAAGIQSTEIVMTIGTFLYWLALLNCGFLMPPAYLTKFWIFMYRVSPLTFIMEGLAVGGLSYAPLKCSDIELLHMPLPQSSNGTATTCGDHLQYLLKTVGGYVVDSSSTTDCQYCVVGSVNVLLAGVGMNPHHTWRNFGLLWCYVFFNIAVMFGLFWVTKVFRKKY